MNFGLDFLRKFFNANAKKLSSGQLGQKLAQEILKRKPDMEKVRALINQGADLDRGTDGRGNPKIVAAALHGHLDVLKEMLTKGASLNALNLRHETPLMAAVRNGHAKIVEFLLTQKQALNRKDIHGMTALDHAKKNGLKHIADLLQKASDKLNPPTPPSTQ